jgi:AcrR family transcriptional regulator
MKPLISPASTAALPKSADLSAARRRLFETALGLFSQYGYNGVSVRDIVAVLDLQPTAIYAHVSSKEELLFELVRIGHEELRDRVREAVLEAGSDPG